ncbi:hypothetical protein GQ600_3475 [Phytophthora cactorum]|nr:hypothetical protein GQ600_3475 [Phytophthora cactorum]
MTSDVEIPQNRVVDDEEKSMSVTRTRQNVQYNQVFVDGPDSFGMYDVSDGEDIDIRSIGVHKIGVVWPIQQQNNKQHMACPRTKRLNFRHRVHQVHPPLRYRQRQFLQRFREESNGLQTSVKVAMSKWRTMKKPLKWRSISS